MSTLFGKYLDKLNINKTEVSKVTNFTRQRINDLCNKNTTISTPIEFYKIVFTSILMKDLPEEEFLIAINEIFPDRPKVDFLKDFEHLSPDVRFIQKHCLTQKRIEQEVKMSDGKISRLGRGDVKELEAIELVSFIEGLELDLIKTFKEIFGEIKLTANDYK